MSSNRTDIVDILDGLIRRGEGMRARAELNKLNFGRLSRDLKMKIASLACRADLPDLTVRILNPLVSPPKGAPSIATEEEKAEYAMGLIYLEAVNEGMKILENLDPVKNPRVLLYRAQGFFSEWNHKEAIPLLEQTQTTSLLSDYQKLVCRVNLAAALVHEQRFVEAAPLLEQLKVETAEQSFPLHGSVLKYWAELKIETHDFAEAHKLLQGAEHAFEHFGGTDGLLIRKWKAIIRLIETKASSEAVAAIHALKDEAREKQQWEIERDCDFYKAIHTHNKMTFMRLYFGTSFDCYRQRILKEWKEPLELPELFDWHLGKGEKMKEVKLLFGEKFLRGDALKVGQAPHRLLSALSSDFYRPFRLPKLFGFVHPDERYNPVSSPIKMHSLLTRVKQWLHDNTVPMTVTENRNTYRLSALSPCALIVPRDRTRQLNALEHAMQRLQERFKSPFSVAEACEVLDLSHDTVLEALNKGIQSGSLQRFGKGRATRYQFIDLKSVRIAA